MLRERCVSGENSVVLALLSREVLFDLSLSINRFCLHYGVMHIMFFTVIC